MKKIIYIGLFAFSGFAVLGAMEPEEKANGAEPDIPVQKVQLVSPHKFGEYLLRNRLDRLLVTDLMINVIGPAEFDEEACSIRLSCEELWQFIEKIEHQISRYCRQYGKDLSTVRAASMPTVLCGCFINKPLVSLVALVTYFCRIEYFRRYPLMQTLDLNYDAGTLIPGYEFESVFYVGFSEFIQEIVRCGIVPHENELGRIRRSLQERYEHAFFGEHHVKNTDVYNQALEFVVGTVLRLEQEYRW